MKYVIFSAKSRKFSHRKDDYIGSLRNARVFGDSKLANSQCIPALGEKVISMDEAENMTKHRGLYYSPQEIVQVITAEET